MPLNITVRDKSMAAGVRLDIIVLFNCFISFYRLVVYY
jgi:hypothetical protein